jgi:hypothetical protein
MNGANLVAVRRGSAKTLNPAREKMKWGIVIMSFRAPDTLHSEYIKMLRSSREYGRKKEEQLK